MIILNKERYLFDINGRQQYLTILEITQLMNKEQMFKLSRTIYFKTPQTMEQLIKLIEASFQHSSHLRLVK